MVGRDRVMREISEMRLGREIERRVKWVDWVGPQAMKRYIWGDLIKLGTFNKTRCEKS